MVETVVQIGICELNCVRVEVCEIIHEMPVSKLASYADQPGLETIQYDLKSLGEALTRLTDRNRKIPKIEFVYRL